MFQTDSVAILMATYNGEAYLRGQLDSILGQSSRDWQLYIHDDGSADATNQIIDEYCAANPTRIFRVEGAPTGGAKNNFFYLMRSVSAPMYLFSDQDDVWLPHKIENTRRKMAEIYQPDVPCMVYTELSVADERLNVVAQRMSEYQKLDCRTNTLSRLLVQNSVTGCTVMLNRCLRDEMLRVRHTENVIMHDWWGALIAAERGKIAFVEEPQILYRQHGDNSVGAKKLGMGYVTQKLKSFDGIRQSLADTRRQAGELADSFGMDDDSLVSRYAGIGSQGKIARLRFYAGNDIKKDGFVRRVGMTLFG